MLRDMKEREDKQGVLQAVGLRYYYLLRNPKRIIRNNNPYITLNQEAYIFFSN